MNNYYFINKTLLIIDGLSLITNVATTAMIKELY